MQIVQPSLASATGSLKRRTGLGKRINLSEAVIENEMDILQERDEMQAEIASLRTRVIAAETSKTNAAMRISALMADKERCKLALFGTPDVCMTGSNVLILSFRAS